MSYIVWSDALVRYPTLLRVNSSITPNSAYVGPAERRVEGYLASHFSVPFSSNNETVRDLVVDMTYLIAGNLNIEDRTLLRDELMARMDRLREGTETMLLDDGTTMGTVGGTVFSTVQSYHPTFGMGDVEDFRVSSSRLYNEEQSRE